MRPNSPRSHEPLIPTDRQVGGTLTGWNAGCSEMNGRLWRVGPAWGSLAPLTASAYDGITTVAVARSGSRHSLAQAPREAPGNRIFTPGADGMHNDGEGEPLLRPEAEVLLGRDVRQCWPTAGFVRFLQPQAADPGRRTRDRRPATARVRAALGLRSPNLVPTRYRGSLTAARPVDLAAAIAQTHRRDELTVALLVVRERSHSTTPFWPGNHCPYRTQAAATSWA